MSPTRPSCCDGLFRTKKCEQKKRYKLNKGWKPQKSATVIDLQTCVIVLYDLCCCFPIRFPIMRWIWNIVFEAVAEHVRTTQKLNLFEKKSVETPMFPTLDTKTSGHEMQVCANKFGKTNTNIHQQIHASKEKQTTDGYLG